MESLIDSYGAVIAGFAGGILLGLAARRGRFCTLGAIEDALYANDFGRIRMWALALGVAISLTFLAAAGGLVALDQTIYAGRAWNPWGSLAGGLTFGYGMALAGNCGYGALARLGGGDLRSLLIVVIMGVAAYAALNGPLAGLRLALFPIDVRPPEPVDLGLAHLIGSGTGLAPLIPALLIAAALAALALGAPSFRASVAPALWSAAVGLAIAGGFVATAWLAQESFEIIPVESHTFTAPLGESLLFLMTSTGSTAGFSIGSVAGVLLGAVLGAWSRGHFRWEACDDARELGRQAMGAALMGIGGVVALGCSVGQGLSAFATLSYSAPVTLAAIAVGAAIGLRQLIRGFSPAL